MPQGSRSTVGAAEEAGAVAGHRAAPLEDDLVVEDGVTASLDSDEAFLRAEADAELIAGSSQTSVVVIGAATEAARAEGGGNAAAEVRRAMPSASVGRKKAKAMPPHPLPQGWAGDGSAQNKYWVATCFKIYSVNGMEFELAHNSEAGAGEAPPQDDDPAA